jgi:hypothetical protein
MTQGNLGSLYIRIKDMGLSSSQARLLNLTARMHQIEYKAARLEAMKLQMANESKRVYEDYLNALDKTKIKMKTLTTDGAVTYQDITSYKDFVKAGYALVYNNRVYSGSGDFNTLVKNIISDHGNNPSPSVTISTGANFETALTNIINSGWVTILAKDPNYAYTDGFHNPAESAEEKLKFAEFETSVATNTGLQEVTDEINLRKEEAKYEADMKRIDMKDRKYDTDLAALDAERNAIKQEMDTLKTVAKDNVDRTFKLFS